MTTEIKLVNTAAITWFVLNQSGIKVANKIFTAGKEKKTILVNKTSFISIFSTWDENLSLNHVIHIKLTSASKIQVSTLSCQFITYT